MSIFGTFITFFGRSLFFIIIFGIIIYLIILFLKINNVFQEIKNIENDPIYRSKKEHFNIIKEKINKLINLFYIKLLNKISNIYNSSNLDKSLLKEDINYTIENIQELTLSKLEEYINNIQKQIDIIDNKSLLIEKIKNDGILFFELFFINNGNFTIISFQKNGTNLLNLGNKLSFKKVIKNYNILKEPELEKIIKNIEQNIKDISIIAINENYKYYNELKELLKFTKIKIQSKIIPTNTEILENFYSKIFNEKYKKSLKLIKEILEIQYQLKTKEKNIKNLDDLKNIENEIKVLTTSNSYNLDNDLKDIIYNKEKIEFLTKELEKTVKESNNIIKTMN